MELKIILFPILFFALLSTKNEAQTSKDIQGTWRVVTTTIKYPNGDDFKMDSSTHNLTKTITQNRIIFTVYDRKTDSLLITAQGKASTKGNYHH
ncbi:hypothetical protein [Rufibacter aurantiacus]|uniref:hypothetical protein n=1 Tax=Rufibacter aurantiacus TaxID=2817374 RepID=UPI001B30D8EC|nr:hypothetical protein [Rufibacter aurantiacus]